MSDERTFQVRVEGIQFDAAHFATFGGDCEPLHGHSYDVAAEVEGDLDRRLAGSSTSSSSRRSCGSFARSSTIASCSSARAVCCTIESADGSLEDRNASRARLRAARGRRGRAADRQHDRGASGASGSRRALAALWTEMGATNLRAVTVEVWEGPGQRASHTGMASACR